MHMVSERDLNCAELETMRTSKSPTTLMALLLMQPRVPILPRASRMKLCLFFLSFFFFLKVSVPCFGHITVVFQSLHGTGPRM